MEQKNNWIKNCLGYSNNKYTTPSGNGKNIPLNKFNENTGKMEPLLKKDGKQKTHNLYLEIQQAKSSTDYKKLIENSNLDLEKVNFILNSQNPKYEWENAMDYTNFGGIETLKSMENKIINTFGSLDKFNEFCQNKFTKFKTQFNKQKQAFNEIQKKKKEQMENEFKKFQEWKKSGDKK